MNRSIFLLSALILFSSFLTLIEAEIPCAMKSISAPETEFVFEAHVVVSDPVDVGETATGKRRYIPIIGGRFKGTKLKGEVLPGGADWQTERKDGVTELDAIYSIRCDDGTVIIVHNRGIAYDNYLRTVPTFVAPEGDYSWLNTRQFVGTVSGSDEPNTVIIRFYMVI